MKKDLNKLEKLGLYTIIVPIIITLFSPLIIILIIWDAFIFQLIWNLLMPKVFGLFEMTLIQSFAINLLITYQKITIYKETRKVQLTNAIFNPLIVLLMAWIASFFI